MLDCCMKPKDNTSDLILAQLKKELRAFKHDTTTRLLLQDGKIAETCVYIKENLSNYLRDMLATMEDTGELSEIITDLVLSDIAEDIKKTNVYFEGITTERLFDAVSSTYYYVTKIPRVDKNGERIYLKMGIANDNPNMNTLESTLSFAHRKNATVCINGGVYDVATKIPVGTVIHEGKILYNRMPEEDKYQFLGIKADGSVNIYKRGVTAEAMLNDGVIDCTCIFGSLIEQGVSIDQTDERKEPRQSIGFAENGSIIIVTCDGRSSESKGMSYGDLVRIHYNLGSFNAFILDGGGSASTVVRGVKQNANIDYNTVDRAVSTFFYVAKETSVTPANNPSNDLGDVKQILLEKIANLLDFVKGYIRLRGQENYYAPGIEMYVNAEESRRSKLGLSFDKDNIRNTYLYWGLKAGETEKNNLFRIYDHGVWVQTYHGTTGTRPNGVVGLCFFDESLGKPIWYDGSKWVDATGTAV